MKSPEFITHGTSSVQDAEKIQNEGFKAEEGRATVSADLIYSFEWATDESKRKGSKSRTEIEDGEIGRMIIMSVPEEQYIGYAVHTDVEIDDETKSISGYSSKCVSGRKQLAIYEERDILNKRRELEQYKTELAELQSQIRNLCERYNIDYTLIQTRDDFWRVTNSLESSQKVNIRREGENIYDQMKAKRKLAEPEVLLPQENVLMSVVPTEDLGNVLIELKSKIEAVEKVDIESFVDSIAQIISKNKDNFIASGVDTREIIENLVESTIETEVMNLIRSLAGDVKRVQGYKVYNRGTDEVKEKEVNKGELVEKLERIQTIVEDDNFDIGMENLNRYIKINIKRLLNELNEN